MEIWKKVLLELECHNLWCTTVSFFMIFGTLTSTILLQNIIFLDIKWNPIRLLYHIIKLSNNSLKLFLDTQARFQMDDHKMALLTNQIKIWT